MATTDCSGPVCQTGELHWREDGLAHHLNGFKTNIGLHRRCYAAEELQYMHYDMRDRLAVWAAISKGATLGLLPFGTRFTHYHFVFNRSEDVEVH